MEWKMPNRLQALWGKIKERSNQGSTQADNSQNPASSMPPYRHRAIEHHPTTQEKQHRATEQHYWQEQLRLAKELNVLTKWLNWITLMGTAGAVVGLFFLWRTLVATELTANATKDAVAISRDTLNFTIRSAHLDRRAWVTVESAVTQPTVPEVGQTYRIRVNFKNSGDTPAISVFTNVVADPVTMPGEPNFSYEGEEVARAGIIAPSGTNFASLHPIMSRSTGEERPFTKELFTALQKDEMRLYIHGHVSYADIFGECHWMDFCMYLLAPDLSSFAICPKHNDTGDEECEENRK